MTLTSNISYRNTNYQQNTVDTLYKHTQSTFYPHALSTHPFNAPNQHTIRTRYQHTLLTLYPYSLSTPLGSLLQLDRWSVGVRRVHGRRRKLLKLVLMKTRVETRGKGDILTYTNVPSHTPTRILSHTLTYLNAPTYTHYPPPHAN